jgi:hypothetical protein
MSLRGIGQSFRLSFAASLITSLLAIGSTASLAEPISAIPPTLVKAGPDNGLVRSPLGTRLSEFKGLASIDRAKYPQARVLCSGDPELRNSTAMAAMRPMPDEQQAGVIRCNVFHPDPVSLSWWAPILPRVDGQEAKSTNYFFLPDGKGDYRLLFVQAVLPDTLLPDTRGQLTEQLGEPKKRNAQGLVTESLWTESWQTPDTWLLLDSRKSSFRHDFTLTYVNANLVDAAAARGFDEQRYVLYYSAFNHYR